MRIFGLILGCFLHTRDEDGALVIDPDVIGAGDERDEIADSKYMEGTKQTTTLAWAWILIVAMAVGVIVLFFMQG